MTTNPIVFATDITRDHLYFLSSLLSDKNLLDQTNGLLYQYDAYISKNVWDGNTYAILSNNTQNLLLQILNKKRNRVSIGCIFESLINHMLDEAYFFNKIILNQISSISEVLEFSAHHNADALLLASHLLDPMEVEIITNVTTSAQKFLDLENNINNMKTPESVVQMIILVQSLNKSFNDDGSSLRNNVLNGQVSSLPGSQFFAQILQHEGKENAFITQYINQISN